jgi:hypothetical protein
LTLIRAKEGKLFDQALDAIYRNCEESRRLCKKISKPQDEGSFYIPAAMVLCSNFTVHRVVYVLLPISFLGTLQFQNLQQ